MKTFSQKADALYEWFMAQPADGVPSRQGFEGLMRQLGLEEDRLGLEAYVDKDVVLQVKQPYQFMLVRTVGKKIAMMLFRQQDGAVSMAADNDPNGTPVGTSFLRGKIKVRASGHYYLEILDETSPGARIEVAIQPDLIGFVSTAIEAPVVLLS